MENKEKNTKNTFDRTRANGKGAICFHRNRKKPYEAQITLGYEVNEKTNKTRRVTRCLGYFKTKKLAEKALEDYEKNQIVEREKVGGESRFPKTITFKQLYEVYIKETMNENTNKNTVNSYNAAFKAVPELYDKQFTSLLLKDLEDALNNSGKNEPTIKKILVLFRQLFKFAAGNKLCKFESGEKISIKQRNIIKTNDNQREKNLMEPKVIKKIFEDKVNEDFADTVKYLLYTGVRIEEFLEQKKADVNIERWYINVRGTKNRQSVRIVPIHPELRPVILKWFNRKNDSGYLFTMETGEKYSDSTYRSRRWKEYFKRFGVEHTPHDTRRTFKTISKKCGCEEDVIEKIMGHSLKKKMVNDYFLDELEYFHSEIAKIKFYD